MLTGREMVVVSTAAHLILNGIVLLLLFLPLASGSVHSGLVTYYATV